MLRPEYNCDLPVTPPWVEGRGGGKGGGHAATEASDTLRSVQVAEVLDLVSEGPIQGLVNGLKSVYLDGIPVQNQDGTSNFENVDFAWTLGTQGQAAMHGFELVQNEVPVGLKVLKNAPIIRTVLAGSDQVRVTVAVPQLSFQDTGNGDLVGSSVEYAIDVQSNGGGFVQVYQNKIDGKTMSRYQRSTMVPLTGAAPWDIRVRRVTPDAMQSNTTNAIWWDSYTEIQSVKLRYPNSALCGFRVNAQHFSRVPVRGYDILGRVILVPANYDPLNRTYAGTWDGTFVPAWSNNPAWVFYDLLTHPRYGLGQFLPQAFVNKWRLYQIAQYCDALVPDGRNGWEPRFTCNLYLQTQNDAYKTLQDLAAVFRGIVLYGNGVVDVVQDAPSDALSLFTPANVIDGKFIYQGTSERTRHSGVIVYWNNLANQGKREPELFQDSDLVDRYGIRNLELSPLGTWSRGQAVRLAKWALYSEDAEGEVVSFGVGSEGALVPLGRVFKIADPSVSGLRLGGRVHAATPLAVTVDKPVQFNQGEAYTLTVALPDAGDPFNLVSEQRTVLGVSGDGLTLSVGQPFSQAPAAQSIWLLESTAVNATSWRCISVREVPGEGRYEVTAVAHDPAKYALIEQGIRLESKPISVLKPGAVQPSNLQIHETVYTAGGIAKSRLTIGWTPGAPGQFFRVSWRYRSGIWAVLPDTSAQNVELADVMPGTVDIAVRAMDGLGSVSKPLEGSYNVGGKDTTGGVSDLLLTVTPIGIQASWSAQSGVDGVTWVETELRRGVSFEAGVTVFKGRALSYNFGWLHWGTLKVWAVHRDSSGNVSAPVYATLVISPPAQPMVTGVVDMSVVKLKWTDSQTTQPIAHYVIKKGTDWEAGTPLGKISGLTMTLLDLSQGLYTFWAVGVDVAGNESPPGHVDVNVGSPISAAMAILNAGLQDSAAAIGALGQQVINVDALLNDVVEQVHAPELGLQAQAAERSMLALALQSTREAYAAMDLGNLLSGWKTDKVMRDAGIVVDPTTGQVHITGVSQTAQQLSTVQADFDAVAATVNLQAQRITQLNTDLVNAQLDPTGAAVVAGVLTQINTVQLALDAANNQITQKASSALVGQHYLQLQQAVATLTDHTQTLLIVAQTLSGLQNDVAAASNRLEVLEHAVTSSTELIAARLGDQAKAEAQDAMTLAALLDGDANKRDAASQLAYAKEQLQASVEQLGISTAQQLTLLVARVGQTETDFVNEVNLRSTADSAEATARQALALKQQTDHNTLSASYVNEAAVRQSADLAEATARQALAIKQQTDHNTVSASQVNEAAVRQAADVTEATARQALALKQQTDHNTVSASQVNEAAVRQAADVTEATARQALAIKQQTDHDTVSASQVNEAAVRQAADVTEATARQALAIKQQTDHDTLAGVVSNDAALRVAADTAEATARQALAVKQEQDKNTLSAAVSTADLARVAGDSAAASQLLQVQATLNQSIAAVSQRLAVVVDANGQVVAAYTLALNVNGHIVGMRLDNNGTVGNIVVQGDKFAFVPPGSNTAVPVFVAGQVNGVNTFGVNGQLMVDGSIYARSLAVDKLSAITAKLGDLTSGRLSINSDGGTNWGYARSAVKWWDDGANGWALARHPDGTVFADIKAGAQRIWMSSWGDCGIQFPGIKMTQAGLEISQVNVIDTLQLKGNAVTVPFFAEGYNGYYYGGQAFSVSTQAQFLHAGSLAIGIASASFQSSGFHGGGLQMLMQGPGAAVMGYAPWSFENYGVGTVIGSFVAPSDGWYSIQVLAYSTDGSNGFCSQLKVVGMGGKK